MEEKEQEQQQLLQGGAAVASFSLKKKNSNDRNERSRTVKQKTILSKPIDCAARPAADAARSGVAKETQKK